MRVGALFLVSCAVEQDVLRDAVLAGDSMTYQRKALARELRRTEASPVTLLPLPSTAPVVPNHHLQALIKGLLREHGYGRRMLCFAAGSRAERLYAEAGGEAAVMDALRRPLLCALTKVSHAAALYQDAVLERAPSGAEDADNAATSQAAAVDPVIAADGFTYSRAAIRKWMAAKGLSPVTKKPLRCKRLVPNRSQCAVLEWLGQCQA